MNILVKFINNKCLYICFQLFCGVGCSVRSVRFHSGRVLGELMCLHKNWFLVSHWRIIHTLHLASAVHSSHVVGIELGNG